MTDVNSPPDPEQGPDQAGNQDQDQMATRLVPTAAPDAAGSDAPTTVLRTADQESAAPDGRISPDAAPDAGFVSTQAESEAAPEAAPVAAPDLGTGAYPGAAVPGAVPEAAPAKVKRKRSIPTPALYSVLIVLGLVVGVGGGYAVQYERKPTPLPPLAAPQPTYPQSALFTGQRPAPLPSGQDDATITDGNLLAALLPTPGGSTAIPGYDHTWLTLADSAANCEDQASCLNDSLTDDVARIAQTAWTTGKHESVEITITQYFPGSSDKAVSAYNSYQAGGDGSTTLPSPTGTSAQGYSYPDEDDSGTSDYMVAMHGDLLIEFLVWTDTAPAPDPSYIDSLVTQQLARL